MIINLPDYPKNPQFSKEVLTLAYKGLRGEVIRLREELAAAKKLVEAVDDLIISTDSLLSTVDDITLEDKE